MSGTGRAGSRSLGMAEARAYSVGKRRLTTPHGSPGRHSHANGDWRRTPSSDGSLLHDVISVILPQDVWRKVNNNTTRLSIGWLHCSSRGYYLSVKGVTLREADLISSQILETCRDTNKHQHQNLNETRPMICSLPRVFHDRYLSWLGDIWQHQVNPPESGRLA